MNNRTAKLLARRVASRWLLAFGEPVTLHLRNKAMADLWREELLGQISDGMWENMSQNSYKFWSKVPIVIGGSSRLEGTLPFGVRADYQFPQLMGSNGGRMLDIVQQSEPQAGPKDVLGYLKEIRKVLADGKIQGSAVDSVSGMPDRNDLVQAVLRAANLPTRPTIVQEWFMTGLHAQRLGSYHYFIVLQGGQDFYACSAFGKPRSPAKAVLLKQTLTERDAQKAIESKMRAKMSEYRETTLPGMNT